MKSLGNMGGILLFRDLPVLMFKYRNGVLLSLNMLTEDLSELPVEFRVKPPHEALTEFLIDQVTPDTRYDIDEELAKSPIQYYDVERMLRYSYGFNIDSLHWIRQDEDISCWDGTALEGKGVEPISTFYDLPVIRKVSKDSVLL